MVMTRAPKARAHDEMAWSPAKNSARPKCLSTIGFAPRALPLAEQHRPGAIASGAPSCCSLEPTCYPPTHW
eukprot:8400759-Alexandrium_andersonii.AAC.1